MNDVRQRMRFGRAPMRCRERRQVMRLRVPAVGLGLVLVVAGCSSPDPEMVEACGVVKEVERAVLGLFNADPSDREAAAGAAGTVINRTRALQEATAETDSEELQALADDLARTNQQMAVEAITGDPRAAAAPRARLVVQMIEVCRAADAWPE